MNFFVQPVGVRATRGGPTSATGAGPAHARRGTVSRPPPAAAPAPAAAGGAVRPGARALAFESVQRPRRSRRAGGGRHHVRTRVTRDARARGSVQPGLQRPETRRPASGGRALGARVSRIDARSARARLALHAASPRDRTPRAPRTRPRTFATGVAPVRPDARQNSASVRGLRPRRGLRAGVPCGVATHRSCPECDVQ